MPRPLILATADWHVRKNDQVWVRRPEIVGDVSFGIQQVLNIAKANDIKHLVMAGDNLEERLQQSDAMELMRKTIDELDIMRCKLYFIDGQHDRSSPPWLEAIHRWPEHLIEPVDIEGVTIFGLDYCDPSSVAATLAAAPPCDILFTHQVWKDFMGEERGDAKFEWIPSHVKMIVTGDYHQHLMRTIGGRTVVSPGPLCAQDLSEINPKGVVIINDDLSIESVPLRTRQIHSEWIRTVEDLEKFVAGWKDNPFRPSQNNVPANIARNILRVHYLVDIPDARKRIENVVNSDVHLFLDPVKSVSAQLTITEQEHADVVMSGGLEGCINHFYADDPIVRAAAIRLYRAKPGDLATEIGEVFKELVATAPTGAQT